jgi:hypothetical protein
LQKKARKTSALICDPDKLSGPSNWMCFLVKCRLSDPKDIFSFSNRLVYTHILKRKGISVSFESRVFFDQLPRVLTRGVKRLENMRQAQNSSGYYRSWRIILRS